MSLVNTVLNQLKRFRSGKDLSWAEIDHQFLSDFETHLYNTCAANGAAVYLRHLRSLYRKAMRKGLVKREYYPFESFRIKTSPVEKRALTKPQIEQLIHYPIEEGTHDFHARNYFLLSFFLRGMNFIDLSRLKEENIQGDRITYIRSKTKTSRTAGEGRMFSVPIRQSALEILNYYRQNFFMGTYILPILKKRYDSGVSERNTRKKKLAKVNASLQALAKKMGWANPDRVTMYAARHSWATITRREGGQIDLIKQGLGHSNVRTTEGYLADFENLDLDKADSFLDGYSIASQTPIRRTS